jgi:hypothetical protein
MLQFRIVLGLALAWTLAGCGGSSETTGATPAPTPIPTPTPYKSTLPVGPVTSFQIKVNSIDINHTNAPGTDFREPFSEGSCGPNGEPCWIAFPGEFIQLDANQANAQGQECQWVLDPTWSYEDPRSSIRARGSSQPFRFRLDVVGQGDVKFQSVIDGVRSNALYIRVKSGPKPY